MQVLSLFSGAGGLDLGIIMAGNKVVWANDIDPDAVETYRKNIGDNIVCDDIRNIICRCLRPKRQTRVNSMVYGNRRHLFSLLGSAMPVAPLSLNDPPKMVHRSTKEQ